MILLRIHLLPGLTSDRLCQISFKRSGFANNGKGKIFTLSSLNLSATLLLTVSTMFHCLIIAGATKNWFTVIATLLFNPLASKR